MNNRVPSLFPTVYTCYSAAIPILQVKRTNALMGKIIQNSDGSKFKEEENRKLTKMVSTIIGIFLLCNSPKIPFFIFANHQPSHGSVWQAITQITGQETSEKPMEKIPNFCLCSKKLVEYKNKGTLLYLLISGYLT